MSRNRKNLKKHTWIIAPLLFVMFIYRLFLSPFIKTLLGTERFCRFTPSCSAYFVQSISEKGFILGGYLWFRRFLACQPFSSFTT